MAPDWRRWECGRGFNLVNTRGRGGAAARTRNACWSAINRWSGFFPGRTRSFCAKHKFPKVATRWERSRRRIARLYLGELAADFYRLHAKARILAAEAPEQYAGLVPILFRQQFVFWRTLVMIEVRLALGGLNVTQGSVEKLIGAIEAMQREIARVAATSPA